MINHLFFSRNKHLFLLCFIMSFLVLSCGPNNKLHPITGIWKLESINGHKLSNSKLKIYVYSSEIEILENNAPHYVENLSKYEIVDNNLLKLNCHHNCSFFLPEQVFELTLKIENSLILNGVIDIDYLKKFEPDIFRAISEENVELIFVWDGHYAV